jgi:hypothetical protein
LAAPHPAVACEDARLPHGQVGKDSFAPLAAFSSARADPVARS